MTRSQTAEIAARLLVGVGILALASAKYEGSIAAEVASDLRNIAASFDGNDGMRLLNSFDDCLFEMRRAELDLRSQIAGSPSAAHVPTRRIFFGDLTDPAINALLGGAAGLDPAIVKAGIPIVELRVAIARHMSVPEATIQKALIFVDPNSGPLVYDLATSYLLFVQVTGTPGTRRILKYAYEHEEASGLFERLWSAAVTAIAGFGVHRVTIGLPNLAAGGSFHVEVGCHDELFISRARLEIESATPSLSAGADTPVMIVTRDPSDASSVPSAVKPEADPGLKRGVLHDGPAPFVHLYVGGSAPGSEAELKLELCLDPAGLLPAGVFICGLVFALLFAGQWFHKLGVTRTGDTAAAVVVAAAGVFAGYLFRPGEHRLMRRFLRELRLDTTLLTGLSFAAAGLLAIAWPERIDAWTLLTLGAFILLLRRVTALTLAMSIRRNVLPIHWLAGLVRFSFGSFAVGLQKRRLWSQTVMLVLLNAASALGVDALVSRYGLPFVTTPRVNVGLHLVLALAWTVALGVASAIFRLVGREPRGAIGWFLRISLLVALAVDAYAYYTGHRPFSQVAWYLAAELTALLTALAVLAVTSYAARAERLKTPTATVAS